MADTAPLEIRPTTTECVSPPQKAPTKAMTAPNQSQPSTFLARTRRRDSTWPRRSKARRSPYRAVSRELAILGPGGLALASASSESLLTRGAPLALVDAHPVDQH